MPISGSDHALMHALAGILRSGAGRAGYRPTGVKVKKYALSGVARSNATRSNYHAPTLFALIGGVHRATGKAVASYLVEDLTIDETRGRANTCRFTAKGWIPTVGMDIVLTLGSRNNLERLYGGQLLTVDQGYVGTPANAEYHVSATDYTWGLNRRKVTERFLSKSATTIVQTLMAAYAPTYTTRHVEAGLESIDEITFTNEDLLDCLARTAKRIGAKDPYVDYDRDLHFFVTAETGVTQPTILNAAHPSLLDCVVSRDVTPVISRVFVEGGGSNARTEVAVGETRLPLEDAAWYQDAGGTVVSGPQRLTYTGRRIGGGGSLVGPGASPTAAPAAALATGSGIESGTHDYAATFVTASGESLPGPRVSITVGSVAAPASAPTAGTATEGSGPDPGSHNYAVTFVTASGETTASPLLTKATDVTAAPSTAPTAGTPTLGGGVDAGTHEYAASFVTAIGETTPGPIGAPVTTGGIAVGPPPAAPTQNGGGASGGLVAGATYQWAISWVTAIGATTPGPVLTYTLSASEHNVPLFNLPGDTSTASTIGSPPAAATSFNLYRTVANGSQLKLVANLPLNQSAYIDQTADGSLGANAPTTNPNTANTVPLTSIPIGAANVTSRKLYRRSGGAGLKLLTTIANNTATTYTDTTANASLGAAAPTTNTAYLQRIPLSEIPIGGALVTQRKIYRTVAGGAQLKLATTLADNTTTTWTDTVTDASLGANVPTSNTATANQVALTGVPIGATSVTQRKIYRTVAAGAQLKLLTTLADNTTTTYTDSTADASLGANVPTSDTSGLAQPAGQVLAGASTLVVAGTGAFSTAGGWAIVGNGQQVIRYTGITGSSLSGIPASGDGAITASIAYNSTITEAPQLTGIPASGAGSIQFRILKGDPVNLWVQRDDLAVQALLAALLTSATAGTHDGIIEDVLQDRRLSYTEAVARGDAHLALRNQVEVSLAYTVRDINTHAGRRVPVNVAVPSALTGDFEIQAVTIAHFAPALFPRRTVRAARSHFSFEDLLRLGKAG
jgi:hypothetical protein